MSATRYRITTRYGSSVTGVVQLPAPRRARFSGQAGLALLRTMAATAAPKESMVIVYPDWSAEAPGPAIEFDIRGATVEIVEEG